MGGADALAAALGDTCDMEGMDDKVIVLMNFMTTLISFYESQLKGCLEDMQSRVGILEQALLSGEGGAIEEQIVLTLVKKGVIDCENSTQCDDDKACMDSLKERGRMLCEPVCERLAFIS